MPQPQIASVDQLVDELIDASKAIQNREGLKPDQSSRVAEAFSLRTCGPPVDSRRKKIYHEFLTRVERKVGPKGRVLCAAALGTSRITAMRERIRDDLPVKLKEREGELVVEELERLADLHTSNPSVLTGVSNVIEPHTGHQATGYAPWLERVVGDTYELTLEDLNMVPLSGQVRGIWLTDAFSMNSYPTITIAISHELRDQLAAQRLRVNAIDSL